MSWFLVYPIVLSLSRAKRVNFDEFCTKIIFCYKSYVFVYDMFYIFKGKDSFKIALRIEMVLARAHQK